MQVMKNGKKVEMSYEDVCKDLGFHAHMKFVKITDDGKISFTTGTPDEVSDLAVEVKGKRYSPSEALCKAWPYPFNR